VSSVSAVRGEKTLTEFVGQALDSLALSADER
jgi:hypothetical protein